jgi:hypothetical protein
MRDDRFWQSYEIPVAISVAAFAGLNFLWIHTPVGDILYSVLPYSVAVYLAAGSGLTLALLWWALRAGRVSRDDLGLGLTGWTAPRRLVGLAVILLVSYGQCVLLETELAKRTGPQANAVTGEDATAAAFGFPASPLLLGNHPSIWWNFCFWFVILLPASLAELLVFLSMAFSVLGRGLQVRGLKRPAAWTIAAVVASVAFGLFHYTYPTRFYPYAFPLMGEMLVVVLFFLLTRNFYLTLALHNAFAATGFMREDYGPNPHDRSDLADPMILVSFIVPFLVLHWVEWRSGVNAARGVGQGRGASADPRAAKSL